MSRNVIEYPERKKAVPFGNGFPIFCAIRLAR